MSPICQTCVSNFIIVTGGNDTKPKNLWLSNKMPVLLVSYRKEGFMTCQRMLTFNWVGLLFGNCCKRRRVSSPRVSRWLIENSMFTRWTKIEVARYTYIKKMPVPCNFQTVIIKVNANNLHVTNQTRVITHFR